MCVIDRVFYSYKETWIECIMYKFVSTDAQLTLGTCAPTESSFHVQIARNSNNTHFLPPNFKMCSSNAWSIFCHFKNIW